MQIEEPIKINNNNTVVKNNDICIGIDLGTTNSVVTFVRDRIVTTIEDGNGDIIPSCVAIAKNGEIIIGKNAIEKIGQGDYVVLQSTKRYIGANIDTFKGFNVFGNIYSPVQISSLILGYIKNIAEKQLNKIVTSCVITVPAYFDDNQRNDTKIAAKMANLEVKRIINEPTAAALAYGLDRSSEGKYLVYDLGGGTFDVSILQMQKGIFRVLATLGNTKLGGDDIDDKLCEYILHKYKLDIHNDAKMIYIARNIKEYLSDHYIFTDKISIQNINYDIEITRNELYAISSVIVEKTIAITKEAIEMSNIQTRDIKGIILVGGATKMSMIREEIKKTFPEIKILTDLDPDKIVAIGAGIKAAGKLSGFENILLDITPLSLGIETLGGCVEKIIYRNTPIPCSTTQYFTTSHEKQTGIVINIVQGEREMAKDCRSLGQVILKNLPQLPPGMPRIAVKFEIDVDGILSVTAKEETSDTEVAIEIKPMYGMDYQKMSDDLISAIENAKSDMQLRLLTETVENAKNTIKSIEKAIDEDGDLLSQAELEKIENQVTIVEDLYSNTNNRDKIEQELKTLEEITTPFLEEVVNKYLQKEIIGKSTKEYK